MRLGDDPDQSCSEFVGEERLATTLKVTLPSGMAYWTVVDECFRPVEHCDDYLRVLRFGRDRSEGTTRVYAGNLALFERWRGTTGRSLEAAAERFEMFVLHVRTTPVTRRGRGQGAVRQPGRVNHVLAAVREMYVEAVDRGHASSSALRHLYVVADQRRVASEARVDFRVVLGPRHQLRQPRRTAVEAISVDQWAVLLKACLNWRDRYLLILLYICGLRRAEAIGLRRSDTHFGPAHATCCGAAGPHIVVEPRSNPNDASVKGSKKRVIPVDGVVVRCHDLYVEDRSRCAAAAENDFLIVNLWRPPVGVEMSLGGVNRVVEAAARRAKLNHVTPHMLRHSMASDFSAAGVALDVLQALLGHSSPTTTSIYVHPNAAVLRGATAQAADYRERMTRALEAE